VGARPDGGEALISAPSDALSDRGPWTEGELATLQRQRADWSGSDVPEPTEAAASTPTSEGDTDGDDHGGEEGGASGEGEPINRGLLLKFLSSVRS
jgi:hypothetical protein